ncbi:MFS superfamily proline/ betaine transporter (plasmid) [Cupriavidus taiwanensis]|uniref:MFS superfamily proline/ betaine transporter n=2 Tax=Cupriavidus taiwanensis TaxID=164546 RepID=A0A7Z7JGJ5_9BURK|nr:MFS superfamily proline/ betaine transporter [Cupriavidus taiwanensis]SOZ97299.1 MFS superfamily proline/ betaine transporter [Cupriavidus taiwanensis]SPC26188.1 MFS superfamily proline/ betaine transporter [Cupriavidus taiwanensis]SPD37679.1 MFS superfamily proline/ betaine transporter [Cupriavidus taiwanensis]
MSTEVTASTFVPTDQQQTKGLSPWRVSTIAAMGSAVEYYDFALYGIMAVTVGPLFFPGQSELGAILATLGVFASAFLVRPLGGAFFGWLGDKHGRSMTLIVTVLGMGIASTIVGFLPTYEKIGIWAPILLLVCRIAQGFFAGGEVSGAVTYISECSPSNRRGFFGAFNPAGVSLGLATAAGVAGLFSYVLGHDTMREWGWRMPFLLCLPLVFMTLWARVKLEDSPRFKSISKEHKVVRTPLADVFTTYRSPLLKVIGIGIAQNACAYFGLVYLNVHLTKVMGYDSVHVFWLMALAPLAAALLMPAFGALSDTHGRRRLLIGGYLGYIVLVPISLHLMNSGEFTLAILATFLAFLPFAVVQSVGYPLYAELFPTRVRFSGVSLGFNIATILGGATTPYLSTWIVQQTGDKQSPTYFVMATAIVAVLTLLTVGETAKTALKD